MPSYYDNTYHAKYSKPVFDTEKDKHMREQKRVNEEIYERVPAPVPTQEMENEYMDFLQEDLKSDPWLTYRFRKYMAGPKRIPWKNQYSIKMEYRYQFMWYWMAGGMLFWPVACMIGKRAKRYQTGVPVVPQQRFIHDFPNVDPTTRARTAFRFNSFWSAALFGFCFAQYMSDNRKI